MYSIIIISLVLCVVLSAFFSCVEMALAKVNKTRIARAAEKQERGAKLACKFIDD